MKHGVVTEYLGKGKLIYREYYATFLNQFKDTVKFKIPNFSQEKVQKI